jgi:alpha-beta hydrolase superfamily lysophospholipase
MTESALFGWTTRDGCHLAVQDWPLPPEVAPRAVVLVVHGLGEHAGRYGQLAGDLNASGLFVRSFDQYGHGESSGARGTLTHDRRLLDDLGEIIDETRRYCDAHGVPLIVLGHSMGGLVASRYVAAGGRGVDLLVLSSPALDASLSVVQRLLLGTVARWFPDFCVGNGLEVTAISHDAAVVAAYRSDPQVHDRVSGRLGRFIAREGAAVLAQAGGWTVPTLLLFGGADRLVNPQGSRAFAAAAPASVVQAQAFDGLYHEIFNEAEPDRTAVVAVLQRWIEQKMALSLS